MFWPNCNCTFYQLIICAAFISYAVNGQSNIGRLSCCYHGNKIKSKKKLILLFHSNRGVREAYNSNDQSLFLELVIVVDNDIYKKMDKNLENVHQYCKDVANIVNSVSQHIIFFS